MGLFHSFNKSRKLARLQRKLVGYKLQSAGESFSREEFLEVTFQASHWKTSPEMDEYLCMCLTDKSTASIVDAFKLSEDELREMVDFIEEQLPSHINGWVEGHYIPLSSIAYPETMLFMLACRSSSGWSDEQVAFAIFAYWTDSIPQGGLNMLREQFRDAPPEDIFGQ